MSHNNICEKNLIINTKFIWKLNGFELSLSNLNMKKENLLKIKPFKKGNLTPEEESEKLDHVEKSYQYTIDVYSWALMFNELLNSHNYVNNENNDSNDYKYLKECLDTSPQNRPKIDAALDMNFFKSSKLLTTNNNSSNTIVEQQNKERTNLLDEQLAFINEFNANEKYNQKDNEYTDKLINYIKDLTAKLERNEQAYEYLVNENFINFILQPFMFFSEKIRRVVLPTILTPKFANNCNDMAIRPFINENKYTAYVLPHILSLFLLKILNIRLVLLDYFKYFVYFIKNNDTLRYEILPE